LCGKDNEKGKMYCKQNKDEGEICSVDIMRKKEICAEEVGDVRKR
jgi:hypothetical protein